MAVRPLYRRYWERVIAAGGTERDRAILAVLFFSGLRAAELVALRLADLDGERSRLWIASRGDWASLSSRGWTWLEAYLDLRPDPAADGPVFLSRRGGALTPGAVARVVRQAAQAAGLKRRLRPHLLRRSSGFEMLRQAWRHGDALEEITILLGHANAGTTRRYLRRPVTREEPNAGHPR